MNTIQYVLLIVGGIAVVSSLVRLIQRNLYWAAILMSIGGMALSALMIVSPTVNWWTWIVFAVCCAALAITLVLLIATHRNKAAARKRSND